MFAPEYTLLFLHPNTQLCVLSASFWPASKWHLNQSASSENKQNCRSSSSCPVLSLSTPSHHYSSYLVILPFKIWSLDRHKPVNYQQGLRQSSYTAIQQQHCSQLPPPRYPWTKQPFVGPRSKQIKSKIKINRMGEECEYFWGNFRNLVTGLLFKPLPRQNGQYRNTTGKGVIP